MAKRPWTIRRIHEDDHLLVVNKPAGVLSVPGRGTAPHLPEMLHATGMIPSLESIRIVHRLDRGASGIIVFAKTLEAQQRLTDQWSQRRVEKFYLAIVRGFVTNDGEVNIPLLVDRDRRLVEADRQHGKPALTRYRVKEHLAGHTLLECQPVTGRLHQIRVHLAWIGHPLGVDPTYGGGKAIKLSDYKSGYRRRRNRPERPLIQRLTLHAFRLCFDHPASGDRMMLEAAPPKDFSAAARQLRLAGKGGP